MPVAALLNLSHFGLAIHALSALLLAALGVTAILLALRRASRRTAPRPPETAAAV
jgi:hypothetical protein